MFPTFRKVVFKIDDQEAFITRGSHGCVWIGEPRDTLEFFRSAIFSLEQAVEEKALLEGTLEKCTSVLIEDGSGQMIEYTEKDIEKMRTTAHQQAEAFRKKQENRQQNL